MPKNMMMGIPLNSRCGSAVDGRKSLPADSADFVDDQHDLTLLT